MANEPAGESTRIGRTASFLGWSALGVALALIHNQSPLYSGNQTTKFLRGMADAGVGLLREDWFANTTDPLPLFGLLIRVVYAYLHPGLIYLLFAVICGVYLYSLSGIARVVLPRLRGPRWVLFVALLLLVHSVPFSRLGLDWLGEDPRSALIAGVANQFLLGIAFQPSNFGVFILLSILLFLRGRYLAATILLAAAANVHTTYMLSAAALTAIYMLLALVADRRPGRAFGLGLAALVIVSPSLLYNARHFAPTSPLLWRQAMDIVVNVRIPHHCDPTLWFQPSVVVKAAMIAAALWLTRRSRLFWIILLPLAAVVSLTLLQVQTRNINLAFLAPWRLSVFLVPMATALVLAAAAGLTPAGRPVASLVRAASAGLVLLLLAVGAKHQLEWFRGVPFRGAYPLAQFVKQTKQPGDVYLVPPRDWRFVQFRVESEAPIFVNWKSNPQHSDREVLDWYERNWLARDVYRAEGPLRCERMAVLVAHFGVTHVVVPRVRGGGGARTGSGESGASGERGERRGHDGCGAPDCAGWSVRYRDDFATLFRWEGQP